MLNTMSDRRNTGNRRGYNDSRDVRGSKDTRERGSTGNRSGTEQGQYQSRGGYEASERRPHRRRVLSGSNLLIALIGFWFIFSFSVVLTLNLRQIYYMDVRLQRMELQTGIPEEAIKHNYDVLIDYNLINKHVKELEFPDFPMSETGRIHFSEVKRIFMAFQILCMISGILFVVSVIWKLIRRDPGSLKLTSILTFVIPIVLGVLAIWNWQAFFIRFHQIFFKNNYWIFNPVTDPVIRILPDIFFLHCAAAILIFVILGGVLTGFLYRIFSRRR